MELSSAPEIMTVQEAAKYLRLKRTTTYEMIRRGVIPSIRFGRQIRVPRAGLEELAAAAVQGKKAGAGGAK